MLICIGGFCLDKIYDRMLLTFISINCNYAFGLERTIKSFLSKMNFSLKSVIVNGTSTLNDEYLGGMRLL